MDNPLSDWLRVREPADIAARSAALTKTIASGVAPAGETHVLDLATGTGSNLRCLVEHLPAHQHWLVVDRSDALLRLMPVRTSEWATPRGYDVSATTNGFVIQGVRADGARLDCTVETRQMDLGGLDDEGIFAGRHLVTASALLDLVSERWLRMLAARCRAAGASALFTLTYNGQSSCSPPEPDDELVRDLLNQHQHTDKGLGGPAAGPDAVECAVRCFEDAGYQVLTEPTDWVLGPADREIQRQLVEGWADAATELASELAATIAAWRLRRLEHLDAGRSRIVVGHDDLAARRAG